MKEWVYKILRDMEAQKHEITFKKEGSPDLKMFIESQLRILPFGVYDYIFPKEDLDTVLCSLLEPNFGLNDPVYEGVGKIKTFIFRKMLNAEKIPEFKRDKRFTWLKQHVAIIPLGIKHDGEITEPEGSSAPGYTHERI